MWAAASSLQSCHFSGDQTRSLKGPQYITLEKGLPNDHARNPIPGRVFASFATFCSNPLRFFLWRRSRHFSGDRTRSLKGSEPRYITLEKGLPNDHARTQSLIGSLLPLLPSVQILFDSFCGTGVAFQRRSDHVAQRVGAAVFHARKRTTE